MKADELDRLLSDLDDVMLDPYDESSSDTVSIMYTDNVPGPYLKLVFRCGMQLLTAMYHMTEGRIDDSPQPITREQLMLDDRWTLSGVTKRVIQKGMTRADYVV